MNEVPNHQSFFSAGVRAISACSASGRNLDEITASLRSETTSLGPLTKNDFILGQFKGGEISIDCALKDRAGEILNLALRPALEKASLTSAEKKRTGVFVGTTSGFFSPSEIDIYQKKPTSEDLSKHFTSRGVGEVGVAAARLAGIGGPVLTYSIACTSSGYALLEAWRYLQAGLIDHAIVIGYETLLNTTMHGFKSLMLYDGNAHRPFDKNRRGLQLGEGCGVVILEREQGRDYLFSMTGGASRNDHSNITGADTGGSSVVSLLTTTLASAGLTREAIVAIKAHGTGTLDNDLGEGVGFRKFFPKVPRFSSIKGYMGHTLGAAGAVEVATWLACLEKGFIPRSIGFETVDEAIGLEPTKETYGSTPGSYLFTYFGFGGCSVGLIFNYAGSSHA